MYWKKKLPRVVKMRDGTTVKTLKRAADLATEQREMNCWKSAAAKIMHAAKTGDTADSEAATKGSKTRSLSTAYG